MEDKTINVIKRKPLSFLAVALFALFFVLALLIGFSKIQPKKTLRSKFSAAVVMLGSPKMNSDEHSKMLENRKDFQNNIQEEIPLEFIEKRINELQDRTYAPETTDREAFQHPTEEVITALQYPAEKFEAPQDPAEKEMADSQNLTEKEMPAPQDPAEKGTTDSQFIESHVVLFSVSDSPRVSSQPETGQTTPPAEEDNIAQSLTGELKIKDAGSENMDIRSVETSEILQNTTTKIHTEDEISPEVLSDQLISSENNKESSESEISGSMSAQEKKAFLAIVIDDMGINQSRTKDILSLQAPLTSSFLTYGKNLDSLLKTAVAAGHEVILHAPMEPKVKANLAPDTLKTEMDDDTIESMFLEMISKFDSVNIKGVNNHMGSLFTQDMEKLDVIMKILKQKNMFFLDSKTTSESKARSAAQKEGVSYAARDVFLDNENNFEYISKQLEKAEKTALKKGFSVAICHPKSETYKVLKEWLDKSHDPKIELVHLSKIVEHINQ